VGDLVEDAWLEENWNKFFAGWEKIESTGIPWSAVPGNHDCHKDNGCGDWNRWQHYNRHMGPHWDGVKFQHEFKEAGKYENSVTLFEAAGVKMMIVGIEYIPSKESLDWAEKKLAEHSDRRAIINIHFVAGTDVANWAKRQRNVFMIHQGHDCAREWNKEYNNDWGEPIQEILTDYQCEGNGFLRYYTFDLDSSRVNAFTYNPDQQRYERDGNSQFSFAFSK
jgi:DNA repair exonuclease SbcCD nuclease subunit